MTWTPCSKLDRGFQECCHGPSFLPHCLMRLEDNHATCSHLLNSVTPSFSSALAWLVFLSFLWVFIPTSSLSLLHEFTMTFFSQGDIYVWENASCFCFSTLNSFFSWINACWRHIQTEIYVPKECQHCFFCSKMHLQYWIFAKLHVLSENALNKEWGSTFSKDSILAWMLYG